MCLILFAHRVVPGTPLIVAANRDERFDRPAAPAAVWDDHPEILAGRDLSGGGTWLGVSRSGRFAALTNFRDPASHRSEAASRGQLVAEFLQARQSPAAYMYELVPKSRAYNGFNLLAGDAGQLIWFSNAGGEPRLLVPGIYGLCNHLLDTPWPKVQAAKSALSLALAALPDAAPLFALLRDDTIHPDQSLPRTGVSLEWERLLSAAFVKAPGYGTRSSTVLRVGKDGWTVLDEQTWLPGGVAGPLVHVRFRQAPAQNE